MKYILAILLLSGMVYFSSCDNGKSADPWAVTTGDSVSKGSNIQLTIAGLENYNLYDYTFNGSPVISISCNDLAATDSTWLSKLVVTDYSQKKFSLNLTSTNTAATGTFTVTNNASNYTDYTDGFNKVYLVMPGSWVNITQSSYPIIGSMNLNLLYNHTVFLATGSFSVFY